MNSSTVKQSNSASLWAKIKGAIARIAAFDIMPSNDIQVRKFQRPNGYTQWQVYNANIHQFEQLNSEDEVMEWIEESHHHTGDAARQFWFFL